MKYKDEKKILKMVNDNFGCDIQYKEGYVVFGFVPTACIKELNQNDAKLFAKTITDFTNDIINRLDIKKLMSRVRIIETTIDYFRIDVEKIIKRYEAHHTSLKDEFISEWLKLA